MDKNRLQKTFRDYKKAAMVDYAFTNPDVYGDCVSCVNAELVDRYGEHSTGIWAKAWQMGMNSGDDISELDSVYVAHDLTDEQATVFYEVFGKDYNISPSVYNPSRCFELFEKDKDVFEVSYYDKEMRRTYSDAYPSLERAAERMKFLTKRGHYAVMTLLFKGVKR